MDQKGKLIALKKKDFLYLMEAAILNLDCSEHPLVVSTVDSCYVSLVQWCFYS